MFIRRVDDGDGAEQGEFVMPTERLEQFHVGGLPEEAEDSDAELDRLPIRRFRDKETGQFIQPLVADAALAGQLLDDRINDEDNAFGDDVPVDSGLVRRCRLAGVSKDQLDRLADSCVVFAGPHVVGRHPIHRPCRPAHPRSSVDPFFIWKVVTALSQAGPVSAGVRADELQYRGPSVPGHGRWLASLLIPKQSGPERQVNSSPRSRPYSPRYGRTPNRPSGRFRPDN